MRCTEPQIKPLTPHSQGAEWWRKSQRRDCKVTHCHISIASAAGLQAGGGSGSVTFFVRGQSQRCHHHDQGSEKVTTQDAPKPGWRAWR